MTSSQNATFVGDPAADAEYDHPPGAGLARSLVTALQQRGLNTSPFDNWRDVGWAITVTHKGQELEIAFASTRASDWLMQVAPKQSPGFLSRLMGVVPDRSSELFAVAGLIAEVLPSLGFSRFRWRADGRPRDNDPELPVPPT